MLDSWTNLFSHFPDFVTTLKSKCHMPIQCPVANGRFGIDKGVISQVRTLSKQLVRLKYTCACMYAFIYLPFYIFFQGRGERAYDIFSRLLKERIVCVMGPVSY